MFESLQSISGCGPAVEEELPTGSMIVPVFLHTITVALSSTDTPVNDNVFPVLKTIEGKPFTPEVLYVGAFALVFVALFDSLERFVQVVTGSVFEYPDKNLASKEMSEPNPFVLRCLTLSLIKRQYK